MPLPEAAKAPQMLQYKRLVLAGSPALNSGGVCGSAFCVDAAIIHLLNAHPILFKHTIKSFSFAKRCTLNSANNLP